MDKEEQIFDFMAAAEDTGKQLNEMARRLPDELKAVFVGRLAAFALVYRTSQGD